MSIEKKVPLSEVKAKLSEFVDEVRTGGSVVVIRNRDKEVAVLVEVEQFHKLKEMEDTFRTLQLREALRGGIRPLREALAKLKLEV